MAQTNVSKMGVVTDFLVVCGQRDAGASDKFARELCAIASNLSEKVSYCSCVKHSCYTQM